jgi:hypothetical protein
MFGGLACRGGRKWEIPGEDTRVCTSMAVEYQGANHRTSPQCLMAWSTLSSCMVREDNTLQRIDVFCSIAMGTPGWIP